MSDLLSLCDLTLLEQEQAQQHLDVKSPRRLVVQTVDRQRRAEMLDRPVGGLDAVVAPAEDVVQLGAYSRVVRWMRSHALMRSIQDESARGVLRFVARDVRIEDHAREEIEHGL